MVQLKWEQYYKSESELIQALLKVNTKVYKKLSSYLKGYEFLEGFQNYYNKNGFLSDRQIYTLKKLLAENIYKYNKYGHIEGNKFYYEIGINGATGENLYKIINL
ncbi:hypothetical protein [Clostridium sp.]|uniref:hypothetical protein n=1 Tax=Clostridium sp. TaxID=1506 RepID=UPI0026377ED6|nr:hypothetical protein [Clostridium sp.]